MHVWVKGKIPVLEHLTVFLSDGRCSSFSTFIIAENIKGAKQIDGRLIVPNR